MNTRARVSTVRLPPNPPISPPVINAPIPVRNTRRAPNTSQSFPAVGCAIAEAKYSAETRAAQRPTETPTAAAIGTIAVAISELLIGLSAAPTNSGTQNRHPNPLALAAPPTRLRSINALRQSGRPVSQAAMMLNKLQHSDFETEASYLGPRQHRTDIAQHRVELPAHRSLAESHKKHRLACRSPGNPPALLHQARLTM
ncbi:Uncharacterised protein [Mycobacteroides abscessus subsp. abscessus]|nr:Uncharacterised protein [Mycobacteroides abscessus subsp. abscessus]